MKELKAGSTIAILEGETLDDVLAAAAKIEDADFVEWRIDGFADTFEIKNMPEALEAVKAAVAPAGLIFTYRDKRFGGAKPTSYMYYTRLNDIAEKGGADYVNIAVFEGDEEVTDANLLDAHRYNAGSIVAAMNNDYLPLNKFIRAKMEAALAFGGDAIEFVSWVYNEKDEVTLMQAVEEFKAEHPEAVVVVSAIALDGTETKRVF